MNVISSLENESILYGVPKLNIFMYCIYDSQTDYYLCIIYTKRQFIHFLDLCKIEYINICISNSSSMVNDKQLQII